MATQTITPEIVNGLMQYINNEQKQSVLNFAHVLADCEWATDATVTSLDTSGVDVEATDGTRTETVRIDFPKTAEGPNGLRMALMGLAMKADIPDGIERTASAQVETEKAERYLKALCNHFNHKGNASYDIDDEGIGHGSVVFDFGRCKMEANANSLALHVSAESEMRFSRIKHVVDDHLVRFANKEELQVTWVDG